MDQQRSFKAVQLEADYIWLTISVSKPSLMPYSEILWNVGPKSHLLHQVV